MSYYVVFHPEFGDLQGLSTMYPSNINDGYVVEEFEGDFPKNLAQWDKVLKKFVPDKVLELTKLQFLSKFTMTERIAARAESANDPILDDIFRQLDLAENINLLDPDVINGLMYIVSKGLLNIDRANSILEIT